MFPPGSIMRRFLRFGYDSTDAHTAYHLLGGLTLLTQMAPSELCYDSGYRQHGNLFSLIVARSSSSRKSSSVDLVNRILEDAIPDAVQSIPGSVEGFKQAIQHQPKQLLLFDEFGAFLAQSERGYMTAMKSEFNRYWDCAPVSRALVKSKMMVKNPRVSIFGACAPGYLERHSELVDWTDGFFARWLVINAERERTKPRQEPQHIQRREIVEIIKKRALLTALGSCDGMSDEADAMFQTWNTRNEAAAEEARKDNKYALASYSRTGSNIHRIATLLAYDYGEASYSAGRPWKITAAEMRPALAIADMHVKSMAAVTENLAPSPEMRERRAVLNAIDDKEPTPLHRVLQRCEIIKRRLEPYLESLIAEHAIDVVTINGERAFYRRVKLQLVPTDTDAETEAKFKNVI